VGALGGDGGGRGWGFCRHLSGLETYRFGKEGCVL
jgi:hypothetical protein